MSVPEKKIHDCHDAEARIEMLDNLYQIAEQERDAALARVSELGSMLDEIDTVSQEEIRKLREQNAALRSLVRDCITLIANVFSPDVSDEELANWIDASVIIFDRAKQMQIIGDEQEQKEGDKNG